MKTSEVIRNLKESGIVLKEAPAPGGSYVSVNVRGSLAFVAIQFPISENKHLYRGKLGKEVSTLEGYEAGKLSALNVLAQINKYVGFENIDGLNHIDVYYQATDSWDEGPVVANGASDFFVEILGKSGVHTRAIFGVHSLPRNFSIGITASFTIISEGLKSEK